MEINMTSVPIDSNAILCNIVKTTKLHAQLEILASQLTGTLRQILPKYGFSLLVQQFDGINIKNDTIS